jgi:hypothetical protein
MINLNNVAFDSRYRYERIFSKSHSNFTTSGGTPNTALVSIAHNLGYVPFFRVFLKFSDDANYYSSFIGPNVIIGNWEISVLNTTTTNLNVGIQNNTTNATAGTVYYRIYAEPQAA